MKIYNRTWAHAVLRALIVAGSGILVGYAFYGSSILVSTMVASQFTVSGITAGLAYATVRGPNIRNGLASLLVWFVVLTWAIDEFNPWMPYLNFAYIVGITGAIFLYQFLARKKLFRMTLNRILLAGGTVAIVNGLIVVVLARISGLSAFRHVESLWTSILQNLHVGALIGLAVGCGIELADIVIKKLGDQKMRVEDPNAP